jgi:hypothetical protein
MVVWLPEGHHELGAPQQLAAASALSNNDFGVAKPPRTMDVHVRQIGRQATDVDVHRTK